MRRSRKGEYGKRNVKQRERARESDVFVCDEGARTFLAGGLRGFCRDWDRAFSAAASLRPERDERGEGEAVVGE